MRDYYNVTNLCFGFILETFIYNRKFNLYSIFIPLSEIINALNKIFYRIRIVFKWIMRGFSGHLPPEQLLCLWDLILGYDSLEIIPLLAVTILSFRKENLMQVNNQQSVEVR